MSAPPSKRPDAKDTGAGSFRSSERTLPMPVDPPREGETVALLPSLSVEESAEWARLSREIRSLASDLDTLGVALDELSTAGSYHVHTLPRDRSDSPLEDALTTSWLTSAPDNQARLASVALRLMEARRALGVVGTDLRTARANARKSTGSRDALPGQGRPSPAAPSARRRSGRPSRRQPRRAPGSSSTLSNVPSSRRAIGGPLRTSITAFMTTNRTEHFDIQMLNALPLPTLLEEAYGDRAVLAAAAQQADELMLRVKHEVDDPAIAGAFLREQVRHWFLESEGDPDWTARMADRWSGLFADSRVHGGRLRPWLIQRLWVLREQAVQAGPLRHKLARRLRGDGTNEAAVARDAADHIRAEVAQAILDDLATHPRDPELPLPLVALSELAGRRQVVTVNDALSQLFSVPEAGPFVILHPNRYPDCDEVVIRPPVPRARGAALAYTLGLGRPSPRPPLRERRTERGAPPGPPPSATPVATPIVPPAEAGAGPIDTSLDPDSIWEAGAVSPETWRYVVEETRGSRGRLSAPPSEFRSRPAYPALLTLLLNDSGFRKAFLAVRWRARPAGPPLIAAMLEAGLFTPEVSTDHEYLEAELGELVKVNLAAADADGRWTVNGWTVAREGSHREGFRFRAQKAP